MATKITAAMVKQLREMTDSPMMECKKALTEADGDMNRAVDILRKMGVAKAVKRAGRATNEGNVGIYVSDDSKTAGMLELACETDFVGDNPKFTGFSDDLAKIVAENKPADLDALKALPMNGRTVGDELTERIHLFGENIQIGHFVGKTTDNGAFASYLHGGGKLGVLVEFSFKNADTASNADFKAYAHDVALHVAATNPVSARREDIPEETLNHEKEIYKAQAKESGKPEVIQECIATGRLEKFYKENVLAEQEFVKNPDKTVGQLTKEISKKVNDTVGIVAFDRFEIGD